MSSRTTVPEVCQPGATTASGDYSYPKETGGSSGCRSSGSSSSRPCIVPRQHSSKRSSFEAGTPSSTGTSPGPWQGSSLHGRANSRRYGKWPPAGNSPNCNGNSNLSRSSSQQLSLSRGQSSSGRCFTWPAYMDQQQLQQAMKRGQVFRAKFRANAANRTEGFCTLEGLPSDLLVRGDVNQNRAMEGDEVAVMPFKLHDWFKVYKESSKLAELGLLPEGEADPLLVAEKLSQLAIAANDADKLAAAQSPWHAVGNPAAALEHLGDLLRTRPDMRVTGRIVSILEPSLRRDAIVGVIVDPATALAAAAAASSSGSSPSPPAAAAAAALASGVYHGCLFLVPLDPRLPQGVLTPAVVAELPEALRDEAFAVDVTSRTFVACRITDWPASSPLPLVEVRQSLGPSGDIDAGTAALLTAEGVKDQDFPLEVYACLPKVPWSMPPAEVATRADFTSWRIFSIDPITARDLDDALSIQPLPGGRWRMGVHIADVAAFVKPNTPLDDEAQIRGTSVYLVQKVIPMLPRLLCEQLCSLQPGDLRFAFSIVWEMGHDGHIYKEWAGRSIINSCAKLAYPMVQQIIEGCFDPNRWQTQLYNGATWEQVIFDSLALHGIASHLRAARFANGSLRLNNTKLHFALDTGGNPVSASPYVQSEANHLVEEFMLLANMRVAAKIAWAFPKHALLRRHPPPSDRKLAEFKAAAEALGVSVDVSTAAALQRSLTALSKACRDQATQEVMTLLATKPMLLAQYFCTNEAPDPATWRHYALATDLYTHFTSPIRRYPDVIVHRLLQAALDLSKQLQEPDNADLVTAPMAEHAELPASAPPADTATAATTAAANASDAVPDASSSSAGSLAAEAAASQRLDAKARSGPSSSTADSDTLWEQAEADDAVAAPREAASEALLKQHQLPDVITMAKIAKHSNETKLSARMVSDGSLRLYLCIMLKQAPKVSWAVVTSVGGDKFFTVYLPEFGCE
eukprot:GHRR01016709.1.p1 GENE.GHRR01016709.1~~GHRR01016709.1.p1  ORF type:complete len:971 (+),score=396.72 GHRR01016709.1:730-3642(+)